MVEKGSVDSYQYFYLNNNIDYNNKYIYQFSDVRIVLEIICGLTTILL